MPGNLADRCRNSISKHSWSAGEDYFYLRRVTIEMALDESLAALVAGSRTAPYTVALDWSMAQYDGQLEASCTCPHYQGGHFCKHVAATILQADKEGIGRLVPGRHKLEIIASDDAEADELYDDDQAEADDDEYEYVSPRSIVQTFSPRRKPSAPSWQQQIQLLAAQLKQSAEPPARQASAPRRRLITYRINSQDLALQKRLVVDFFQREEKQDGELGKTKSFSISARNIASLADAADRELFSLLLGNHPEDKQNSYYGGWPMFPEANRCVLAPPNYRRLLPLLCASGRFGWANADPRGAVADEMEPILWDEGPPWRYRLRLDRAEKKGHWRLGAVFERDGQIVPRSAVRFAGHGVLLFERTAALFEEGADASWLNAGNLAEGIEVPEKRLADFLTHLAKLPALPSLELPEASGWRETTAEPSPRVEIRSPKYGGARQPLEGTLCFDYRGQQVAWRDRCRVVVDGERRELVRRELDKEHDAWRRLLALDAKPNERDRYYGSDCDFHVSQRIMPQLVGGLVSLGWHVEAEGHKLRKPGNFKLSVSSGVDWFELDAHADYDGASASLPELLKALQRGESFVRLDDGSRGMLPEEWLARYAPLAELGKLEDGKLRFSHTQALLIDAWLAEQPGVDLDAAFRRVRDRMQSFRGIKPVCEPKSFHGQLRDYQRGGLGWLNFLDDFGFGGCLADDMGLGKTVQVLALLEAGRARRNGGQRAAPSLVVAPRSLIHNWIDEAKRFAPELRVLDYTGLGRAEQRSQFGEHELIVTTYGTLRRDVGHLKDVEFDYCIVDEAQAIKNADSQAAKACRLLQARRRLAMTGTPVENHLGELWSIFEFLNPGMLGRSSLIKQLSSDAALPNSGALEALAKGLRPFLLRRTKEQVLKELPEKTEQTLFCELEKKQRKLYDELLQHYRDSLGKKIETEGLKKSKIHVLEALLRLRQAACHPGLLDRKRKNEPSAKLVTLLEQLAGVLDGGHKALVFSQFTSLLAIVREQLDRQGVAYEYLDGKTRDRKARVERFQNDPACPLFLISLKAGGLGLNLTAADYVFILDPWWNPAAEAQAVDRAHRMGQSRRVFAYRLIAQDTIEEKILKLQADKRLLAEAIVSADKGVLSKLTAEDLQWLLS